MGNHSDHNPPSAHYISDEQLAKLKNPFEAPPPVKSMTMPKRLPHPLTPSPERIAELLAHGFCVDPVTDTDPPYYRWMQPLSGAVQDRKLQPYRSTAEQAWYDCDRYYSLSVPYPPEPDWYPAATS